MLESIRKRALALLRAVYFLNFKGHWSLRGTATVVRSLLAGDASPTSSLVHIPLRRHRVLIDGYHLPDWKVLSGVFIDGIYDTDYHEAIVVDVGAHRGLYSAFALHAECAVLVAFEPAPSNFSFLQYNIDSFRSPWQTTVAHQKAVGGRTGSVEFHVYSESWSHSTVARRGKTSVEHITVDQVTFDSAVEEALSLAHTSDAARLIVKIDVEGAEYDILEAASRRTLERIDELFIEAHGGEAAFKSVARRLEEACLRPVADYSHDAGPHQLHRFANDARR